MVSWQYKLDSFECLIRMRSVMINNVIWTRPELLIYIFKILSDSVSKYNDCQLLFKKIQKSDKNHLLVKTKKFKRIQRCQIDRSFRWEREEKGMVSKKKEKKKENPSRLFHNVPESGISHRFVNYGVGKCKSEFRHLEPDQRLTSTHHHVNPLSAPRKTP